MADYKTMPKAERDRKKDQGGFVGGYLVDGKRKKTNVKYRSLICLDADTIPTGVDFIQEVQKANLNAYALYSMHSHTKEKPRYRIVIPMARTLSPEEYEPCARAIASTIGIAYFDPTTYEVSRLMYWPSCPQDGEYYFDHVETDGKGVDPAIWLAKLTDWHDAATWPIAMNETTRHISQAKKQGMPSEKNGIVGAFCRVYDIPKAINTFLPEVYTPYKNREDRWTYKNGTTAGGLVVYDGGQYAYSNHATDPISGQDVNAFDLVRIHNFEALDVEATEGTPMCKMPSFLAMCELAKKDTQVRSNLNKEVVDDLTDALLEAGDFDINEGAKEVKQKAIAWLGDLHMTKQGKYIADAYNFLAILTNDPRLKDGIVYDKFSHRIMVVKDMPWRVLMEGESPEWQDSDDAQLRNYISMHYAGLTGRTVIDDALVEVTSKHSIHQVQDYLESLQWDGQKRIPTMLHDWLGAPQNPYTQEIAIKWMKAAVARVYKPGIKHDAVLVLKGPQHIGKSSFLAALGGAWFNDSIDRIDNKDALESLQGAWIIELGEMQAATRAEQNQLKAFITRRIDRFRLPYGRRSAPFPRQCIFAATTNDEIVLKDRTGGRRFWIVECSEDAHRNPYAEMTPEIVGQYWAEALARYKDNPQIMLSEEGQKAAKLLQEANTEGSEMAGLVERFLEMLLPRGWEEWSTEDRQMYCSGKMLAPPMGVKKRKRVCVLEIWCECFGNS